MDRNLLLNYNIEISRKSFFPSIVNGSKGFVIESNVQINNGLFDIEFIGGFSKIGGGNSLITHTKSIGRFTTIERNVNIGMVVAPENFITSSFHFRNESTLEKLENKFFENNVDNILDAQKQFFSSVSNDKIVIGHDVFIGCGTIVHRGVSIGHGSIIRANSVLYDNVPPYAIVEGNPGKIIGFRFSPEVISKILDLRWWAYDIFVLDNVKFDNVYQAIDQIYYNIRNGEKVNFLNNYLVSSKEIRNVDFLNIELLTDNKFLPVYVKVAEIDITLDFNNLHERNYFFSENNKRYGIDALIAKEFIKIGDVVLDAGANIGYTALHYLLNGADRVYAFEPVVEHYNRLIELKTEKILKYNLALGNENTISEIFLSTTHRQGSTLKKEMIEHFPKVFGQKPKTQLVEVVQLDKMFLDAHFNFMKIDVEGSEVDFLEGAISHLAFEKLHTLQIELYPEYFDKAHRILLNFFTFVYRVGIDYLENKLIFLSVDKNINNYDKSFQPPMYIYTKSEIKKN